jgi:hypothetical protein
MALKLLKRDVAIEKRVTVLVQHCVIDVMGKIARKLCSPVIGIIFLMANCVTGAVILTQSRDAAAVLFASKILWWCLADTLIAAIGLVWSTFYIACWLHETLANPGEPVYTAVAQFFDPHSKDCNFASLLFACFSVGMFASGFFVLPSNDDDAAAVQQQFNTLYYYYIVSFILDGVSTGFVFLDCVCFFGRRLYPGLYEDDDETQDPAPNAPTRDQSAL